MRRSILIILLVAAIGYALFTFWPLVSPYLPGFEKAGPVGTVPAPAPAPSPEAAAVTEAAAATPETQVPTLIAPPTVEAKLVDPFALRIAVRNKAEEAAKAAPAPAPTAPGGEKPPAVKTAGPKLEGVWIDSGMRIAFISGQALNVGGRIMGWRVASISRDSVVLQKGSVSKTLRLEGR